MKVETIRNRTQLVADEGMWLCNETSKVFAHRVTLGSKSNETTWKEITDAEKTRLEAEWGTSDNDNQLTETEQKAKAYDILMGVSE
jgi:hypothetical protein